VPKLMEMAAGKGGKIVELTTKDRRMLGKLANLGIIPGAIFCVVRRRPALILQLGYTRVAIDPILAEHVWVENAD